MGNEDISRVKLSFGHFYSLVNLKKNMFLYKKKFGMNHLFHTLLGIHGFFPEGV